MNDYIKRGELMDARQEAIWVYENANIINAPTIREKLKPLLDKIVDVPAVEDYKEIAKKLWTYICIIDKEKVTYKELARAIGLSDDEFPLCMKLERDIKDYGMAGKVHSQKSKKLYDFISKLDFENGDYFCFKDGGDGDNGEFLMDLLDCYFLSKQ